MYLFMVKIYLPYLTHTQILIHMCLCLLQFLFGLHINNEFFLIKVWKEKTTIEFYAWGLEIDDRARTVSSSTAANLKLRGEEVFMGGRPGGCHWAFYKQTFCMWRLCKFYITSFVHLLYATSHIRNLRSHNKA